MSTYRLSLFLFSCAGRPQHSEGKGGGGKKKKTPYHEGGQNGTKRPAWPGCISSSDVFSHTHTHPHICAVDLASRKPVKRQTGAAILCGTWLPGSTTGCNAWPRCPVLPPIPWPPVQRSRANHCTPFSVGLERSSPRAPWALCIRSGHIDQIQRLVPTAASLLMHVWCKSPCPCPCPSSRANLLLSFALSIFPFPFFP